MDNNVKQAIALLRGLGYSVSPPQHEDELFSEFWTMYGKKVDRRKALQKWNRLSMKDRRFILDYLPRYIEATPDIQYRRNPVTFLNNRSWENDLPAHHKKEQNSSYGSVSTEPSSISRLIEENDKQRPSPSDEFHVERQRIFRLIEAVRANPKSFARQVLEEMQRNGTLFKLHIEWNP